MPWLEIVGWLGSLSVVVSLTLANLRRFRVLNLIGCVLAVFYNLVLSIWPYAAMNAAISLINVYWLVRLYRERHDAHTYVVLAVRPDDPYLHHVLAVHAQDIERYYPDLDLDSADSGRSAFLVLRQDETVGAVVVRDLGSGTAQVELDYVSPRFRDYSPGEFVYHHSELFTSRGIDRLLAPATIEGSQDYYTAMGFTPREGRLELAVPAQR